ncbi:MAG: hypothetical protein IT536_13120 [Hyphomicrobiales bacterium]|nr:hypothetical protein [Hyphomicrobiales bacterium]
MWKLALMLVAAAMIVGLGMTARDAGAETASDTIVVTCGGAIQNCPKGKKAYCNRWRPCKAKAAKVKRYCDQPVCMTERASAQ